MRSCRNDICNIHAAVCRRPAIVRAHSSFAVVESNLGLIVTLTGTVSDFDKEGLFGLIIADEGSLLAFNLRETPPAQRGRFEIGTRVKFIKHASQASARAVMVVAIEAADGSGPSSTTAQGV